MESVRQALCGKEGGHAGRVTPMAIRMAVLARYSLLFLAHLTTFGASSASAQVVLNRIVGPTEIGDPLVITRIDGQTVGTLAMASGVPMGFEGLPMLPRTVEIIATRKSLRAVLDAIVAADSRYEWQENDGVVFIRPIGVWGDESSLLHRRAGHMTLDNISANDALTAVTRLIGLSPPPGGLDTRRFSVEVHEGATILDALNAIVRAHGTMTWVLEPRPSSAEYPRSILLFVGSRGIGVGIPAAGPQAFNADYYVSSEATRSHLPLLDRLVGTHQNGTPFAVSCLTASSALQLAAVTGVPLGFESVAPAEGPVRCWRESFALSGFTLREALDALVTLDARYEWHEVYGVVNMRPATAWSSSQSNLFRLVPSMRLENVSSVKAIDTFLSSLTGAPRYSNMSDTRRISIDLPNGVALDLLNELARTHGELSWAWEELTATERRDLPPEHRTHRYGITFSTGGQMQRSTVP